MYRGRVHEPDACTLTDGDYLKRVKSLTVFFLGNQLVKLSYSKKTTTETLEFHHIAVYGNQVEGIAGVMPPLLLCEPASQI